MKFLRSFVATLLVVAPLNASPVPDFPHLSVNATAVKSVAPDEATITFTVLSFQESSEAAVNEVNKTLKDTVAKLVELGIKEDQVTADDLEKSVTRERNKDYQHLKILGYEVKRSVEVKVTDLQLYPKAATLIFKTDLIKNVQSSFDISEREELLLSLYTDACLKAKKKASVLEKAAGVKIFRIHGISPEDEHYEFGYGNNARYGYAMSGGLPDSGDNNSPPLFVPKEISLEASVSLLFRLTE